MVHDGSLSERTGRFGFTPREWQIVAPLSIASFFENYDYALLSIGAATLSRGLGVSSSRFGVAVSIIRLAGLASILLVRQADRVGRRRMLLLTLTGFIVFTALTAGSWGLVSFVVASALARLFLTAEGAMSGIVIAEEVDPSRRGRALSFAGVIGQTAFGALALLIALLPILPFGWRFLYLVALGPLLLVVSLRRRLPETAAFRIASDDARVPTSARARIERRWWGRVACCGLLFGLVGAFQTAATYHSVQLAQHTYGWGGEFTIVIVVSGPFTLAGFIMGGRGSDHWGRRPLISAGVVLEAVGMMALFLGGPGWWPPGWFAFVVGQGIIAGCWLAFVGELVPTEIRATVI
jgi:MFS family permease